MELLITVVDLQPGSVDVRRVVDALLVFTHAHLAQNHGNHAALIACCRGSSYLFPSDRKKATSEEGQGNEYRPFAVLDKQAVNRLHSLVQTLSPDHLHGTHIAGALSLALCYINRISLPTRILVVSSGRRTAQHYIPTMNCIFAAQKLHVPIDVLSFGGESGFLQQAASVTHGIFHTHDESKGSSNNHLLGELFLLYTPSLSSRPHLLQATDANVDFRASCFCHRRTVDVGYVCSVCLSIFCSAMRQCKTCHTKFAA